MSKHSFRFTLPATGWLVLFSSIFLAASTGFAQPQTTPVTVIPNRQPSSREGVVDAVGKFTPRTAETHAKVRLTRSEAEAQLRKTLDIKQTGPDTYALGKVILNTTLRTVSIPVRLNMRENPLEYALVTEDGKRHEALLTTDVRPEQFHLGCLLLGLGSENAARGLQAGEVVSITVTWERNGPPARYALGELLALAPSSPSKNPFGEPFKPMTHVAWLYNGSFFTTGGFAAGTEGSFISLISDPAALINNGGSDRDNDKVHFPRQEVLPAPETPMRLILSVTKPLDKAK
jgi:hypothetical protein